MHGLFRWSSKWWPGTIPLAVFWAIAAWTSTTPLEADLAARSNAALRDTVLDKARMAVAGRDVTFAADAFSEDGRRSAVASVEAVPGVRLVDDQTRLVPEAKPFVWSAERDVARVTLGGSSPLPASKNRLLEAARAGLGGVEVVDRMNLSRGAPPRFDNAALLLLDQIGKLKDGKVTLSDTKVSLSGMARDLGGREAIAAALKNLPEGFSVAANEVKAPPYVFQAYKDPVAVTVTLTGYVPDNNVHAAIVTAAGRKFLREKVVDNLKASVGAPAGFANAVVPALGALARLSTGTLVVSDREVKLSGDALYEGGGGSDPCRPRQGFPARLAVQAGNFGAAARRRRSMPPSVSSCWRICWPRRKSASNPGAPPSIRIRRRCSTAWSKPRCAVRPSISRSPGIPTPTARRPSTRTLSERRAQAVTDYLVKAGLPANRFTPIGYGSTQPLGSNDTDEGKAQNRRIDFVVRKGE